MTPEGQDERATRKCICCGDAAYGQSAWCALHAILAGSRYAPNEAAVDAGQLEVAKIRVRRTEQDAVDGWDAKG
jgi:hypothetical protein